MWDKLKIHLRVGTHKAKKCENELKPYGLDCLTLGDKHCIAFDHGFDSRIQVPFLTRQTIG